AALEFTVIASDPDGITPMLTTSALPGSATFDDAGTGTGLFSWTPTYDDAGSYSVTVYATDDSAEVDSETVVVTVENVNRAPTISSPVNAEGVVDEELVFFVTGADPDGGVPELSATSAPAGVVFTDSLNGVGSFLWTPALADIGVHEVIFAAFDGDLQTVDTTVITVTDVASCCDIPGDFNNDGSYNIGDVTAGIAYIFSGGPAPPCPAEADFNADGAYNIGDVTAGIAFIFSGGPAPDCGT
ncbi:MAG TPA: putative Ig domain-containing protein, partial [candidate division Zixibacteria bacterium]|nr:putative Ig domain-containing protein [candidate division Zixibacteria bacterium]